ncbi:MAG TPA: hypothetical protein VHA75_07940 [Rugosimonospora sp.]|nr:hypothetical protein [Rugosimonospora sp.]
MNRTAQTLLSAAALLLALTAVWFTMSATNDPTLTCNNTTGIYTTPFALKLQPYDPACVDPATGGPK